MVRFPIVGPHRTHRSSQFFLKGTQLQQLSEEYQIILENITKTDNVLKSKHDALPELKEAYKQAVAKFKQATELLEQQGKMDELTRELAWAHVNEKQTVRLYRKFRLFDIPPNV